MTHRYGYWVEANGSLSSGACGGCQTSYATNVCHGEFHCVACLQVHAQEQQASGVSMEYAGNLGYRPGVMEEGT